MPTYKTPGVFVEETALPTRTIEGQGTGTTAFIGMTGRGPVGGAPPLLTSFEDYRRFYGPGTQLRLGNAAVVNHVANAVYAFFENGGTRLYVVRIVPAGAMAAHWANGDQTIALTARTPGGARLDGGDGNIRANFAIDRRASTKVQALRQPPGTLIEVGGESFVVDQDSPPTALAALPDAAVATIVSLRVTIAAPGAAVQSFADLGFDRRHPRAAQTVFGENSPEETLVRLVVAEMVSPAALCAALEACGTALLTGGSDGDGPPAASDWTDGMARLDAIDAVSIIAAPGSSALPGDTPRQVADALIALAESPGRHRFAVIDPPPGLQVADVAQFAASFDTAHAALYYPWVVVADQERAGTIDLPPSGFLCGIYARNDIERGVWKAPANEIVQRAIRFTETVNKTQQDFLNPKGVNCLCFFEGRGLRVFGARTLSSDPGWKYVSQRRYCDYLERSIGRGIAWAIFEPNGERLWAVLVQAVKDFLTCEWRNGALLGTKPEEAFFVRCDRSTMTQNDLDNGRVVILIGVAMVRPAEFVIFRLALQAQRET